VELIIIFAPVSGSVTDHSADLNGRGFETQLCSLRLKSEDKTTRVCLCVCVGGGVNAIVPMQE